MKFNITNLKFKGIDDKEFDQQTTDNLHKQIANTIFNSARTIPVHEAAKRMYKGEEVELSDDSVAEIKQIIEQNPFKLFVQIPLTELLTPKN